MAGWPVVQLGAKGENVRSVQYLLNAHGSSLAVDGDFGAGTQGAVEQFQTAHGLQADGSVGNQTWPVLVVQVQSGATGPAVEAAQSQVDSRVKILAVDGDFGPQTVSAVTGFQGPAGLMVDGIVGTATWNALVNGYLAATSSESAAQAVFQAWADNNQAGAARNATSQAVAQLFAQAWSPGTWTFAGCQGAAGSMYCTWDKAGGQLVLRVNNNVGAPFYYVTSATF